jgi:glyoxylase I family protein
MSEAQRRNVRSIFHININCSDLGRSVAFYEMLGFTKALEMDAFEGTADESYEALGIHGRVAHRGPVVLFLGDEPRQTRLDLMQWLEPVSPALEPRTPQTLGVPRIALWTKDIGDLYQRIGNQIEFVTPPAGPFEDRAIKSIACLRDPDGLLVELIEFLPTGSSLYRTESGT